MATHYDTMRVAANATDEALHVAYRRLARELHPDSPGGNEQKMARLNEAWRVLGDPARRAMYDASLRGDASSGSVGSRSTGSRGHGAPFAHEANDRDDIHDDRPIFSTASARGPRRWPAMALMLVAAMAAIFVFTAYAATVGTDTVPPPTSPRLLGTEMCVALRAGKAVESPCDQPHYGVVKSVIDRDGRCPASTEGHFSNDGEHIVCVSTAE
jgi:hypothetical protein